MKFSKTFLPVSLLTILITMLILTSCTGGPEFYWAARKGDKEQILALIAAGDESINEFYDGWSPLMTAVKNSGNLEIINLLVENGAEINPILDGKFSPLQLACYTGNDEVAQYLITQGADVNANFLENPLSALYLTALYCNEVTTLEMLLEKGADVNFIEKKSGYTPLLAAIENGKQQMIMALIEAGADINISSTSGTNAFLLACKFGTIDLMKTLVKRGADPLSVNNKGENGFMYLAKAYVYTDQPFNTRSWNKDTQDLSVFLDIMEMDHSDDIMAWHIQMSKTYNIPFYEKSLFLRNLPKNSVYQEHYKTLLDAMAKENIKKAEYLTEIEVDITNATLLDNAVIKGNRELTMYLIEKGIGLTETNREAAEAFILLNQWKEAGEALGLDNEKRVWDEFTLEEYNSPNDAVIYIYREPALKGVVSLYNFPILNGLWLKDDDDEADLNIDEYMAIHFNAGPHYLMLSAAAYSRFLRPNQTYFLRWNKDGIGFVSSKTALEEIQNNRFIGSYKH